MPVTTVDPWIADLFAAIDRMDPATVAKAFAEDACFRFANQDPVVGRAHIEETLSGIFATLGGLRHEVTGVWSGSWASGEVTAVESDVTYTRTDGTTTPPIPATSTIRRRGAEIADYRVFVDIAPLWAIACPPGGNG